MHETRSDAAPGWPNPDLPTVCVAMPCRNERRHIERSVASVLAFDYPPRRLSVLIVDGMSDDGSREVLERIAREDHRVRLIDNPDRLPAPAMNRAIEAASSEVLLRVDAHTVYPPDYARRCVELLLETGAQNVGGVCETVPGADTPMAAAIAYALGNRFGVGSALFRTGVCERRSVDTVPFGCWRLDTLKGLGGFATDLPYAEDDELNARLRSRGGRIVLDPAIRSRYIARADLPALALMMYRYGRGKPRSSVRVGKLDSWRQTVPPAFVMTLAISAAVGLASAKAWIVGAAALLAHVAVGTCVAARAPPSLTRAARARLPLVFLTMHVAYGVGYLTGLPAVVRERRNAA